MGSSDCLSLLFRNVFVGRITDCFCSDDTWHGTFELKASPNDAEAARRALEYIEFCKDWNERVIRNANDPPDASEFECFSDVLEPGRWTVNSSSGEEVLVESAPVFFSGGEISWRLAQELPVKS